MWTVLIQCRLVGKAIRVYNALEEGIARDYQKVKALFLKAYDLVPEAYRLIFRNDNKHPSQSFVEFARVKENQFDDWIKSRQVVSFASLRERLLLEEFKKACSKELRVHLEEVKVVKVSNAAQLADEYVLTHRSGASGNKGGISGGPPPQSSFGNKGMPMSNTPNRYNNPGSGRQRTCFWCNKPGHFQNQCHARRRYLERNGQNPVSLISTSSDVCDKGHINVKFLRDTGSARSLVLGTSLSGLKAYSGNYVVLGGFPNTVISAPLVEVSLSFPGYDGVTELAVVENLPIHGHIGVWKTFHKLAQYCWWPGMKLSVKLFVKECEVCQVIGKPNQIIPKAPLNPIPAIGEPSSELVVDVVGPLPKTKTGFEYILTIMDRASRFPEACLLRKITSKVVFEKLIEFFSRYGLPRVIQTDCGTNFTSKMFRGKRAKLAIRHITSVPYHPESQGVVERFHQTFKSILKKNCYAHGSEWDKELLLTLFAIRNQPNASTDVAPFDLIFGQKVRGPLDIFYEAFGADRWGGIKVGKFMDDLRKRMVSAWKFARDNLGIAQKRMKVVYDRNSKARSFEPGEMVLVLSMNPDNFLKPRYKGPWKVLRKLSEVNYEIEAPGSSKKCRIFHINRLKAYHDLFRDFPGRTSFLCHEVDVGSASPVKQSPYQLNPTPFVIAVDASDVGLGGVLFQRDNEGEVHPISYFSRKLLSAGRRYSTIEKEALALVRTLLHFKLCSDVGSLLARDVARREAVVSWIHNCTTLFNRGVKGEDVDIDGSLASRGGGKSDTTYFSSNLGHFLPSIPKVFSPIGNVVDS
ncbi:uncharacterized protein [Palaemon carinicauda]|uniref:uncharacterized protein n=1 Tax=Palaemon carinicauda TaxID=392227 RepID=UPI0035B68545